MKRFCLICVMSLISASLSAQRLRVTQEDTRRVYREAESGHAVLLFQTSIDGLLIKTTAFDAVEEVAGNSDYKYKIDINLNKDKELGLENYRVIILQSPESSEYRFETANLESRHVYYYTVVLPDKFPSTLSAEYLFSKTAGGGVRLSYGSRLGGFVSVNWPQKTVRGSDISEIATDTDVSHASFLGYSKMSVVAGVRFGIIPKIVPTYVNLGLGYGKYCKLWSNPYIINGDSFFTSDSVQGFCGELSVSVRLFKILVLSVGADMIMSKGKITSDYQIGVGLIINL